MLFRGAFFGGQEITHEVDVSPVGNLSERFLGLTESNVFFDQASVGELDSISKLLFPPTIEPVSSAGFPLEAWSKFLSLTLEETLGFFVVRVDDYSKLEAEPAVDVFDRSYGRRREASLSGRFDLAGTEKVFDGFLHLILTQLAGRWYPETLREFLELGGVPIAIVELGQGH